MNLPTPYRDQEPFLFLIHSPRDGEKNRNLPEQLARSYRLWYDGSDGSSPVWTEEMEQRLLRCTAVVVLITTGAAFSHLCRTALTRAILYNKQVLPVLLSHGPFSDGLSRQLQVLQPLSFPDPGSEAQLLPMLGTVPVLAQCRRSDPGQPLNPLFEPPVAEENVPSGESTFSMWTLSRRVQPPVLPDSPPVSGTFSVMPSVSVAEPDPPADDVKTVIISEPPQEEEDEAPTVIIRDTKPAILLHVATLQSYVLTKPQIKLGRSRHKCDVVLEGASSVSKEHAQILCYDGRYVLMDLGSANGTFLNGSKLEKDAQTELKGTSVFWLHDQVMVLITGEEADAVLSDKKLRLLLNSGSTAACTVSASQLALNRGRKWPDGTLSDPKVHRSAHARLVQYEGQTYLVDESPENGNGTFLNERRLLRGTARPLTSGDKLRLGDTVLQYISIQVQGDSR